MSVADTEVGVIGSILALPLGIVVGMIVASRIVRYRHR
jgi:uncharacterized protein YneF (UPF0154 family)